MPQITQLSYSSNGSVITKVRVVYPTSTSNPGYYVDLYVKGQSTSTSTGVNLSCRTYGEGWTKFITSGSSVPSTHSSLVLDFISGGSGIRTTGDVTTTSGASLNSLNNLMNGQILPEDTGYVRYVNFYGSYMKKIGNLINLRIELYGSQVSIPANSNLSIGAVKVPYTPATNTRIGISVPNTNAVTGVVESSAWCIIEASGEIVLYMGSAALNFCFINFTYMI